MSTSVTLIDSDSRAAFSSYGAGKIVCVQLAEVKLAERGRWTICIAHLNSDNGDYDVNSFTRVSDGSRVDDADVYDYRLRPEWGCFKIS